MPSERFEAIFRRDLDRLPSLPDDQWVPQPRRSSAHFGIGHAVVTLGIVLLAIGIASSLQAIRNSRLDVESGASSVPEFFILAEEGAPPASATLAPALALPICPRGEHPLLDVSHPPPPGTVLGSGVAGPEAAFRRAKPAISEFTVYPFGESQPVRGWDDPRLGKGPVWVVAGTETFVVMQLGGPPNVSWFAYPARFIRCMTPPDKRERPSPTTGPVG